MPLLERTRVEIYLPDLPSSEYQNLLRSIEEELTYAFGGATLVVRGDYLDFSRAGLSSGLSYWPRTNTDRNLVFGGVHPRPGV